jgi:5-methylcytosine-specific restriction endonuclease McrBC regulatory subunit McrC
MYELDINESFCFLFPTDYLFEGFVGGFMQSILQGKAKVRLQASEITLVERIRIGRQSFGSAFTMRHDILVEHKERGLFIFDTKYKGISRIKGNPDARYNITQEASQPDLYQMFTYAIKRDIKDIYLLYPMYRFEDEDDEIPQLDIPYSIDGIEYNLTIHIIRIPFIFEDDTDSTISRLSSMINGIFA